MASRSNSSNYNDQLPKVGDVYICIRDDFSRFFSADYISDQLTLGNKYVIVDVIKDYSYGGNFAIAWINDHGSIIYWSIEYFIDSDVTTFKRL